ncbi:endonuclease/exonuclease/phosphatase family protein [Photobacterium rosenbergii]|uniref:Endonuclease/exonuclease/phosphatase family protein n=1 Tax=Photobacterium rosenbergii TaxID=294936 RepID=A0ABU3ZJ09_9GAMM|nr:endonuclease/exonuclease/phosphatase family protein [Photobacterium rosenbergii]MDV5170133.1 endonuclease/exonuclease/phosphatase family protein [Photobacterium rosenbergii]
MMNKIAVALLISLGLPAMAADFDVMSFNIRNSKDSVAGSEYDGNNTWDNRKAIVVDIIAQTDIAGLQEAFSDQIGYLARQLPEYSWVGVGRDDGNAEGEAVPIFYRNDKYVKLGGGTFWLSETPQVVASVGWDADLTRITTWVRLEEIVTGKRVLVFNAHFDHIGQTARQKSTILLSKKADEITAGAGDAVIVLGDLNFERSDTASYKALTDLYQDAREITKQPFTGVNGNKDQVFTYQGYGKEKPEDIDYIFVNDKLAVNRFEYRNVIKDGIYASDHLSVISNISFQ